MQHVQIFFLGLSLLLPSPLFQYKGNSNSVTFSPLNKLFIRDQPRLRRFIDWDGQILVQVEYRERTELRSLNVQAGTTQPFSLPCKGALLGVAQSESGGKFFIAREKEGRVLYRKEKDDWVVMAAPEGLQKSEGPYIFTSENSSLCFLTAAKLFFLHEGKWVVSELQENSYDVEHGLHLKTKTLIYADHFLLHGRKLYLGFDEGEWGGALIELNIESGKWNVVGAEKKEEEFQLPVTSLKRSPAGEIWASCGLGHLGISEGELWIQAGTAWKRSSVDKEKKSFLALTNEPLNAITFSADKSSYLLSATLGVLKFEKGEWRPKAKPWPEGFQYVSDLRVLPDELAVIGTYDSGILLWDLNTDKVRRVTLKD